MNYTIDPVTMQVVRYRLEQVADQMGYTMVRTSRSTIIKEIMDITCAIFDEQGKTIAQAHHAPMLLTGFEITMAELLKRIPLSEWKEGDVIISNDPYLGGQHLTDLQTFAPIFYENRITGFVGTIAHHSDIGGSAPGSVAGGLTEIYAEGLRLPMVYLYRSGKENPDVFDILSANIRVPDKTLGDVRAQAAASFVGIREVKNIFEKYSPEVVKGCMKMLMDYSEKRMRAGLLKISDGVYSGEDFVDDDGIEDKPIRICVNIHKKGDTASVNFDGTDPQVKGNINCPISTTHAAVYYALICVIDPHVPPNSGCYRPFTVTAQPGTVVNPLLPGAVQARTNTSQKISEATIRALSKALPEKVTAGSHGNIMTCGFSGWHPGTRKRFVYIDIQGGGAGARPGKDGRDGQDSHLARFMNTPVEAAELECPVRIERYELIKDSGGPGKTRGALALRRDVHCLAENMTFSRYADRQKFPPFGILGGKDGATGRFVKNPALDNKQMKSKGLDYLKKDDVISIRTPGGGGYGSPFERDPAFVLNDVLDEKISIESAEQFYGVVIDKKTLTVDLKRTTDKRSSGGTKNRS
ncbi:MAG: hydantoinase B/oxoprolinase family protein [Planctomycetes bacterium]|nr:hydantoinase B/oxoprolinase family protein [Planctomycetota bacterium]